MKKYRFCAVFLIAAIVMSAMGGTTAFASTRIESGYYDAWDVYISDATVGGDKIKIEAGTGDVVGYDHGDAYYADFDLPELFDVKKNTTVTVDLDEDATFWLPDDDYLPDDQRIYGVYATVRFYISRNGRDVSVRNVYIDGTDMSGTYGKIVEKNPNSNKITVVIDGARKVVLIPGGGVKSLEKDKDYKFPVLVKSGGTLVALADPIRSRGSSGRTESTKDTPSLLRGMGFSSVEYIGNETDAYSGKDCPVYSAKWDGKTILLSIRSEKVYVKDSNYRVTKASQLPEHAEAAYREAQTTTLDPSIPGQEKEWNRIHDVRDALLPFSPTDPLTGEKWR